MPTDVRNCVCRRDPIPGLHQRPKKMTLFWPFCVSRQKRFAFRPLRLYPEALSRYSPSPLALDESFFIKSGTLFRLLMFVGALIVMMLTPSISVAYAQTQHGAASGDQRLILPAPRPLIVDGNDGNNQDTPLFPQTVESDRFIRIATGPVRGGYYGVGGVICDLINADMWRHRIECLVRPTAGSVDNIALVLSGSAEFGLVQSDWQAFAVTSEEARTTSDLNFNRIRAVAGLYPLALQIVSKPDSQNLADLKEERIGLPIGGSAQRQLIDVVLTQAGMSLTRDTVQIYESHINMASDFCQGNLDAFFVVGPAPMQSVDVALSQCGGQLLPLSVDLMDTLMGDRESVASIELDSQSYPDQVNAIQTLGFIVTLVTSEGLDDNTVAEVARHLVEGAGTFAKSHPVLSSVDGRSFFTHGLTAPMHNGVVRYLDSLSQTSPSIPAAQ